MYDHLTPAVLATEAVMTLAAFDGVVAFVEGPRDQILFEGILPASFRLIHCVNKDRALEVLDHIAGQEAIPDERKQRVVALVDADFDRPLAIESPSQCFRSDYHDVELMIIESPAFERWLREFCPVDKLQSIGGAVGVRSKLLELASFLGAMRLYARRHGIGISFEDAPYETLVDKGTLSTNCAGFAQSMYNANRAILPGMTGGSFCQAVAEQRAAFDGDLRDLVQGHDVVAVLGIMMRKSIASLNAQEAQPKFLAKSLRLAYRFEDWRRSGTAEALASHLRSIGRPLLG
jgi:hypothetical protein